jgi:hypothetical protein
LIEKVVVYPVGNPRYTPELMRETLNAVLDTDPDLEGTDQMKRLEQDLHSRIDNRDLRLFNILFRGGSMRVISPSTDTKLVLDLDKEAGTLQYLYFDEEGKPVWSRSSREELEIRGED